MLQLVYDRFDAAFRPDVQEVASPAVCSMFRITAQAIATSCTSLRLLVVKELRLSCEAIRATEHLPCTKRTSRAAETRPSPAASCCLGCGWRRDSSPPCCLSVALLSWTTKPEQDTYPARASFCLRWAILLIRCAIHWVLDCGAKCEVDEGLLFDLVGLCGAGGRAFRHGVVAGLFAFAGEDYGGGRGDSARRWGRCTSMTSRRRRPIRIYAKEIADAALPEVPPRSE